MTTKNAAQTNVVPMPTKGDKAQANDAYVQNRADILGKIDTAEDLLGTALVDGLRMTIVFGPTSKDEVRQHYTRCNSPDVYASWFNLGDRAQKVVGRTAAQQAIDGAIANGTGSMFQRAREALKNICDQARTAGVKELTGKAAKAAVKAAVTQATTSAAERKKNKSATATLSAARGTKSQDTKTMAAAALQCGKGHKEMAAFIRLASQQAHRLPAPEGREDLHTKALAALAAASEAWAGFL
jgi:hypothetical protein